MIVVADASILVVALGDDSQVGQRARDLLVELSDGSRLSIVRNLTPLEVMSAFRRLVQLDKLDPGIAATLTSRFASLPVDRHDLTLADQSLLAALVLRDAYQQDTFSSRAINDLIEECGRPRIAHITSAISGLISRSFLVADEKVLSLSREGRAKARGLIGMMKRRAAA